VSIDRKTAVAASAALLTNNKPPPPPPPPLFSFLTNVRITTNLDKTTVLYKYK
jgi:hypothetical protein